MQNLNSSDRSNPGVVYLENLDLTYFHEKMEAYAPQTANDINSVKLAKVVHDLTMHIWSFVTPLKFNDKSWSGRGFFAPFPHHRLKNSLQDYVKLSDRNLESYALMDSALQMSMKLLKGEINIKQALEAYHKGLPLTLGTGWRGHAVEVTMLMISPTEHYLVYTNKGLRGDPNKDRKITTPESNVMIYKATKKLTREVVYHLINYYYTREKEGALEQKCFLEGAGITSLREMMGLKLIAEKQAASQSVPNCSWVNAKGGIRAMILLDKMKKLHVYDPSLSDFQIYSRTVDHADSEFKNFSDFTKFQELEHLISLEDHFFSGSSGFTGENYVKLLSEIGTKLSRPRLHYAADRQLQRKILQDKLYSSLATSSMPLSFLLNSDRNPIVLESFIAGSFFIQTKNGARELNYTNEFADVITAFVPEDIKTISQLLAYFPFLRLPIGFQNIDSFQRDNFETCTASKAVFLTRHDCEEYLEGKKAGKMSLFEGTDGYFYFLKLNQDNNFTGFINRHEYLMKAILKVRSHQNHFQILRDRGMAVDTLDQAKAVLSSRKQVLYKDGHTYRLLTSESDVPVVPFKAQHGGLLGALEEASQKSKSRKWAIWRW